MGWPLASFCFGNLMFIPTGKQMSNVMKSRLKDGTPTMAVGRFTFHLQTMPLASAPHHAVRAHQQQNPSALARPYSSLTVGRRASGDPRPLLSTHSLFTLGQEP